MQPIRNDQRPVFTLPGLAHRTIAGAADGLRRLDVWQQTLDPGAATPVHYHECEEVIVILEGSGRLTIDGVDHEFGPDSTLVVPPRFVHQVRSSAGGPIRLIAVFDATPARAFLPDGTLLPLPWQS